MWRAPLTEGTCTCDTSAFYVRDAEPRILKNYAFSRGFREWGGKREKLSKGAVFLAKSHGNNIMRALLSEILLSFRRPLVSLENEGVTTPQSSETS